MVYLYIYMHIDKYILPILGKYNISGIHCNLYEKI